MTALVTLSSFDSTERHATKVERPETYRALFRAISTSDVAIARGAGLSYSAASFGPQAVSIDLTRFDRILSFDETSGAVQVEAGVRVGDLAQFLAQRGRYLPALPGYPTITVGGSIAFDIHGKSQFHSGNFGKWVRSLDLHHRDHGDLSCSRDTESEIFALTVGGAGLTGVITRAWLDTLPLTGGAIELVSLPVKNLLDAAEVLRSRAPTADCLYSWNDLNRRGQNFGAGVVYSERFVYSAPKGREARASMDIRTRLPFRAWNRASVTLALRAYRALQRTDRPVVLPLDAAFFPIYGKEYYYAAFGPGGFREYQIVVPFERWPTFVAALEPALDRASLPVTLGSLKLFAGESKFLRFCMSGICLALDVPAVPSAGALFAELDTLAIANGALLNLSKDSRLSAATCERIFPEYRSFADGLLRFDPKRRYQSRLRTQAGV